MNSTTTTQTTTTTTLEPATLDNTTTLQPGMVLKLRKRSQTGKAITVRKWVKLERLQQSDSRILFTRDTWHTDSGVLTVERSKSDGEIMCVYVESHGGKTWRGISGALSTVISTEDTTLEPAEPASDDAPVEITMTLRSTSELKAGDRVTLAHTDGAVSKVVTVVERCMDGQTGWTVIDGQGSFRVLSFTQGERCTVTCADNRTQLDYLERDCTWHRVVDAPVSQPSRFGHMFPAGTLVRVCVRGDADTPFRWVGPFRVSWTQPIGWINSTCVNFVGGRVNGQKCLIIGADGHVAASHGLGDDQARTVRFEIVRPRPTSTERSATMRAATAAGFTRDSAGDLGRAATFAQRDGRKDQAVKYVQRILDMADTFGAVLPDSYGIGLVMRGKYMDMVDGPDMALARDQYVRSKWFLAADSAERVLVAAAGTLPRRVYDECNAMIATAELADAAGVEGLKLCASVKAGSGDQLFRLWNAGHFTTTMDAAGVAAHLAGVLKYREADKAARRAAAAAERDADRAVYDTGHSSGVLKRTCPGCLRQIRTNSLDLMYRHGWRETGRKAGQYGNSWQAGGCAGTGGAPIERTDKSARRIAADYRFQADVKEKLATQYPATLDCRVHLDRIFRSQEELEDMHGATMRALQGAGVVLRVTHKGRRFDGDTQTRAVVHAHVPADTAQLGSSSFKLKTRSQLESAWKKHHLEQAQELRQAAANIMDAVVAHWRTL